MWPNSSNDTNPNTNNKKFPAAYCKSARDWTVTGCFPATGILVTVYTRDGKEVVKKEVKNEQELTRFFQFWNVRSAHMIPNLRRFNKEELVEVLCLVPELIHCHPQHGWVCGLGSDGQPKYFRDAQEVVDYWFPILHSSPYSKCQAASIPRSIVRMGDYSEPLAVSDISLLIGQHWTAYKYKVAEQPERREEFFANYQASISHIMSDILSYAQDPDYLG